MVVIISYILSTQEGRNETRSMDETNTLTFENGGREREGIKSREGKNNNQEKKYGKTIISDREQEKEGGVKKRRLKGNRTKDGKKETRGKKAKRKEAES